MGTIHRKKGVPTTKPRIEIDLTQVEALASRGLSQQQIADALGISERTLRNRKKDSAEFAEAIKRGRAKGISKVANVLYEKAMSGSTPELIFFMKAVGKWRDMDKIVMKNDNTKTTKIVFEKPDDQSKADESAA